MERTPKAAHPRRIISINDAASIARNGSESMLVLRHDLLHISQIPHGTLVWMMEYMEWLFDSTTLQQVANIRPSAPAITHVHVATIVRWAPRSAPYFFCHAGLAGRRNPTALNVCRGELRHVGYRKSHCPKEENSARDLSLARSDPQVH